MEEREFEEGGVEEVVEDFGIGGGRMSYWMREGEEKKWKEEWEKNLLEGMVMEKGWVIESRLEKD